MFKLSTTLILASSLIAFNAFAKNFDENDQLAIIITKAFPESDICTTATAICGKTPNIEKYYGSKARFESPTPIKSEYGENVFKIKILNGPTIFFSTKKDDPFDNRGIISLSSYNKKIKLTGTAVIEGSSITISKVIHDYGYEYTLSTGQTFYEDEFTNLKSILRYINKDNEKEFLNLIDGLSISKDDVDDIFFISMKSDIHTRFQDKSPLSPYVGFNPKEKTAWVRLKLYYADDRWLFIKKALIKTDDYKQEYNYLTFKRDNSSGIIWEWNDSAATNDDIEMLKKVVNGDKTIVRFYGDQYHDDRLVSAKQKKKISNVISMHDLLSKQ